MPLYEYECPKDGRFELIRRFSDPPLKKCPTCGRRVEKMIAAPAFHLKGSGWYVTDYARKSKDKGNGTEASKNDDSKSADSSKSKDSSKAADSSKSKDSSASPDAKTSTPSTSTKESSAPKGSSPT